MIIQDNVGEVQIKLGNPSPNHIEIFTEGGTIGDPQKIPATIQIAQWGEIKKKIDKMFSLAAELTNP